MPLLNPDLFGQVIPVLQQTITIIHRVEDSRDEYGQPVFVETTSTVMGHFQVVKAPDTVTELGIRVSRSATIFVPWGTEISVNDHIIAADYPDIRWSVIGTPYKSSLQMECMVQEVIPQ